MLTLLLTLILLLPGFTHAQNQIRYTPIKLYEQDNDEIQLTISKPIEIEISQPINPSTLDQSRPDIKEYLTFKVVEGITEAYVISAEGASSSNIMQMLETTSQSEKNEEQSSTLQNLPVNFLKLKQGLNIIQMQAAREFLKLDSESTIADGELYILLYPKMESKVIAKLGEPHHGINFATVGQQLEVELPGQKIHGRVFRVQSSDDYLVRFIRHDGFPEVRVISCPDQNQIDCIYSSNYLPEPQERKYEEGKQLFKVERMMTQEEQYQGKGCTGCHTYILIQSYAGSINMTITLKKVDTAFELKENEIKREYLAAGSSKEYIIWIKENEPGFASLKVYEGMIQALLKDNFNKIQKQFEIGEEIVPIQIPVGDSTESEGLREVHLFVTAPEKDSTFSVLYSSGKYEIFLKDGETLSHQISPKQQISFYYKNQQLEKGSMYFSLSINDPVALSSLGLHIFYYEEIQGIFLKSEYLPSKPLFELEGAKSMVLEIPGKYPKYLFSFNNTWANSINLQLTINDEQIIFLPLYHNLPLQVDKDQHVNLLVKNNQQGFIQLTIKKCDDSNPTLAYSLDSSDFLNEIYDYESVGQSERITKNSIKVKKGKGLYVRISGDSISNSFIEVTARYMHLDRKKMQVSKLNKGDHGLIKYQLLTDSKAQITFTGLECGQQCRDTTMYECFWSSSRADLYRKMICPNSFLIGSVYRSSHTGAYTIDIKPAKSDNEVSFKHLMNDNILYLSVKATHTVSNQEFYYKDIQIVTIEGQISRLSTDFKKKIIIIGVVVVISLYIWVTKRSRRGYQPIGADHQHPLPNKTQIHSAAPLPNDSVQIV